MSSGQPRCCGIVERLGSRATEHVELLVRLWCLRDAKISARNDLIRAAQKARKRDATGVAGIRKMTGGDPLDER